MGLYGTSVSHSETLYWQNWTSGARNDGNLQDVQMTFGELSWKEIIILCDSVDKCGELFHNLIFIFHLCRNLGCMVLFPRHNSSALYVQYYYALE